MDINYWQLLIIYPLVFAASLIDAVAGGGGLISLPAYLIAGLPPHNAIATNKLSSSIGTVASTVTIHQDGSMHVREAIVVHAEGNQIKKGIYRELPLLYSGPANYSGTVPFTVTSASIDGVPLNPTETEIRGDYIRVLMRGKEPLSTGQHRFVLEYDTSLHLRFYESNGELNWNATGVWGFPILSASCRVILPKGVTVQQTAAWAGLAGSRDSDHITIGRP